jgi:uncharacterized membrane protein YcaP (DUF421 family)
MFLCRAACPFDSYDGIRNRPPVAEECCRDGRIVKANLIKNQINVEQLLVRIRNKGCRRIHDVEFAILEAGGQHGYLL